MGEFYEREARHTTPPDAALIFMPPKFVGKSRHPYVPDSFGFSGLGASVDHWWFQYSGRKARFLLLSTARTLSSVGRALD